MRKIITLLTIVLSCAHVIAQDVASYEAKLSISIFDLQNNHTGSCENRFDLHATFANGTDQLLWSPNLDSVSSSPSDRDVYNYNLVVNANLPLTGIYFFGTRGWKNAFTCNDSDDIGATISPGYLTTGCLPEQTYDGLIPAWASTVKLTITPRNYNLYYFGTGGSILTNSSTWYLPQSSRVTVKATSGYSPSLYTWQYQIGEGAWISFPTSLYAGNVLSFSGSDISSDYINSVVLAKQTIRVRSSAPCGIGAKIIELLPVVNTPILLSASATAQSCAGVNDGTTKITLSRALYAGETLSIRVSGSEVLSGITQTQLDAFNSFTMTGLAPATRSITIQTMYNNRPGFGSSGSKNATVAPAQVITYSNLTYYDTNISLDTDPSRWYLPPSSNIAIMTTPGYTSNQYKWEYQIGNASWTPFPASVIHNSMLTFSGNDISNDYVNSIVLPNQAVRVRVVSACGTTSNVMQLLPILNPPGILSVTPTAQSCAGINDGKIKITLGRPLYTGETLMLSTIFNNVLTIKTLTQAQVPGGVYTMTNLVPGTYDLSIQSTYNGRTGLVKSSVSVTVPPKAFTFTITSTNIHCPGGQDGLIRLTVSGGSQPYFGILEQTDGDGQTITFVGNTGSFTNLPAGEYAVRMVDSKACAPQDGNGAIQVYTPTITEPTSPPVVVSLVDAAPPSAGGLNGSITVRATGGSGAYSFLWIELNTGAIFTAEPPVNGSNGVTSHLSGIGAGQYQVVVRDSQYALANPQTDENTAGCQAVLDQALTAMTARTITNGSESEVRTGIAEFYVTPNPVSNRFSASVALRDVGNFSLTLFNSQGVVVSQQNYTAQSTAKSDFEIPAANKRGIYLLRLVTAGQSSAIRVLVE